MFNTFADRLTLIPISVLLLVVHRLTYCAHTADTVDGALVKSARWGLTVHVTGQISLPASEIQQGLLQRARTMVEARYPLHVLDLCTVPARALLVQPLGAMF